jgi:hypothetical protein
VDPNSQALFPAYRATNTIRFQVSHNQARFSGSIPMPLSRPWTRVLVHASEGTVP